jgi:F-type H+-transporting ATPase subunit epsilon
VSNNFLELEILAPDGVVLQVRVGSLQAADASGRFGLWPGHERFFTVLAPCVLVYRTLDGREHYAAADGGELLLEEGRSSIDSREAFTAERLEAVAQAAHDMVEARRTQERTARSAFTELESSLLRQFRKAEVKK